MLLQFPATATLLAGPEKVTVELKQPTVIVTTTDWPGDSFPLDGLTEAPWLDADQLTDFFPTLISFVEHVQEPPVGLILQLGSLGKVKLVGLTDSLGGFGLGVGLG